MLRLPRFDLVEPTTLKGALALLDTHGEDALVIAGGTDLVPNMKHKLFEPKVVVSLGRIDSLVGVSQEKSGELVIGAMTRLDQVASNALVQERAPALAQATSLIAGPQLRTMGTLGGNVMLETRCQWYNQTYFWRKSLGYCLKKDGTECHVVAGGKKCVAAASNDSAPALMSLGARAVFHGPNGRREVLLDDLWKADGIYNKKTEPGEILTELRIPSQKEGHRGAYGKLRDRGSIDFPLLGIAVRLDVNTGGEIADADVVAVALAARPIRIRAAAPELVGTTPGTPQCDAAIERVAEGAFKQCHPLANIPGDHDHRRDMVPVYVRRTLRAAIDGTGPVHHI